MIMSSKSLYPDRVSLISTGPSPFSYGTYGITVNGKIPSFEQHQEIYRTETPKIKSGMHIIAYCSFKFNEELLVKIVSRHMTNLRKKSHRELNGTYEHHTTCLNNIKQNTRIWRKLQILYLIRGGLCTERAIVSLAYEGLIRVGGIYNGFAPSNHLKVPLVTTDIPVSMCRALGEFIFIKSRTEPHQLGLGWYLGYVHLFRRDSLEGLWYPVTQVGRESENGEILARFLMEEIFPQLARIAQNRLTADAEIMKMPSAKLTRYRCEGFIGKVKE
ncbi:BgtAc-30027 [Blumeria graminis f. sp. tritici]|uniref:BgtAc-30027 n=3 Tax=Blumeria graminis TaxID=34373 RepID=A0A9X9ML48_BLUGR|nr:hypothetical protein BGT96224_Ac30027 [Blumeria graminis f. sp. tritici 96224]VDB91012.1 BgtAc-30027 [Blumeria graminis f. sp. tritici]